MDGNDLNMQGALLPRELVEDEGHKEILHLHRCVYLPLVDRGGKVPDSSGLNWGQRGVRDPDEAYISIPSKIRNGYPGFFPSIGERFELMTDDGQSLVGVRAQDDGKALETPEGNAILGRYFRNRLGVPPGQPVTAADLHAYGRLDVGFTKVGERRYWMEFGKPAK